MLILLTNDDGIDAPGLAALYQAIRSLGDVRVVAPSSVRSASGHGVTFHRPITARTRRIADPDNPSNTLFDGVAVDAMPADCVKLAVTHLVKGKIDLVVSGMNSGANIGVNVHYSGTVAAAREAALLDIPSIAVSLHIRDPRRTQWGFAAQHARRYIDQLVIGPISPRSVLNLNLPVSDDLVPPRGLRTVPASESPLVDRYEVEPRHTSPGLWDADDQPRSWVFKASDSFSFMHNPPDCDVDALLAGFATLTPLRNDATAHDRLDAWRDYMADQTGSK